MKKILLILCFPVIIIANPNIEWFEQYNGSSEESHGHYILTCDDGGFLQIGESNFLPNSKILIVKTNSNGMIVWSREINVGGHNLGNSAIELDDGYLISGSLNRNSALIKLNKQSGATIFTQTFNNGGTDAFEHAAVTPDGIVAVGYIYAQDSNNTFYTEGQGFIMFLDLNGNEISSMNLNEYIAQAYRINYINNELIISGLSEEALDFKVIKMTLDGQVVWHQSYGGNNYDHCFGMDVSNDGSIFLAGHTLSGTQNWDTYTIKLNNDGNLIWEQKVGNPRGFNPQFIHDEAWGIKSTNDGGCVTIAGTGDEYNYSECNGNDCSDTWNAYLIKFSNNGSIESETTFSSLDLFNFAYDWAGEDIDITNDGGAIIAIDSGQFGFLKVSNVQSDLNGDINNDNSIDVLDVVLLVNVVLGLSQSEDTDINQDSMTNILDVVQLINIILE
ncbi:MAG: hypothetical protein CMG50_05070 [Candidatus Marinimicrobia bacterium]|nr:hypothetical protein [Candidatus Neomarinimicrobiota bacterium]|tara:strand:- start:34617 stop:35951 length:1335 start_codon:yes stop_codon:yes gene_type:complete